MAGQDFELIYYYAKVQFGSHEDTGISSLIMNVPWYIV